MVNLSGDKGQGNTADDTNMAAVDNQNEAVVIHDIEVTEKAANGEMDKEKVIKENTQAKSGKQRKRVKDKGWKRMFTSFLTLYRGWRTYMKYEVAFAGLGLAALYMTVLGFDNITVGKESVLEGRRGWGIG